jgi:tricorn protease
VDSHGVDPDVEVTTAPHDWAAARDPQLDTAVRLASQALKQRTPAASPTVRIAR